MRETDHNNKVACDMMEGTVSKNLRNACYHFSKKWKLLSCEKYLKFENTDKKAVGTITSKYK